MSLLILFLVDTWILRILILPLFFFILGYPLTYFFSKINRWERLFLSFGLSSLILLLVYYFQYFTDYYIGVTPTFIEYSIELIICLWISIAILYFKKRQFFQSHQIIFQNNFSKLKEFVNKYKILIGIIIIAAILRFVCLDSPDLTSDETFFIGVSFPVIDNSSIIGLPSMPWAILSSHHPHVFFVQETITLNLLNAGDWLNMYDWMAKFLPAFLGTLTVLVYYGIVKNIFNKWAGYISALFLATVTYPIFISRVAYQECLIILFLGIIIYFAYKDRWGFAGFFIGLSLLTKFSALTIIPPILLYLLVRYFRFDMEKFKILLKKFSKLALIVLIMYLPVIIANIATYIEFGYADSFWSRLLGLPDPMVEAVGEAELPIGSQPGLLQFFPLHLMQLINVFGVVAFGFLIFCLILALFDKKEHLTFNLILFVFIVEYLLVFTLRWYQIITLSPLIVPFAILSSRFAKLIPTNSHELKKKVQRFGKGKRKIIVCAALGFVIGFSTFYSWNTVAIDHSLAEFGDDYTEAMNPAYYFSNLAYLWISRYGYDDVMNVIRQYSTYQVYIDDYHPSFSYIYYFYVRGMNLLISDWSGENDSLFVFYKNSNYIWEPFEQPSTDITAIKLNITIYFTLIYQNQNFQIYKSN